MITADEPVFPMNVVQLLAIRLATIDEDVVVVQRRLVKNDPNLAIGVYPANWVAESNSSEFPGNMPTLQQYRIGIQAVYKDMNEENGIAVHSVLAKRVQMMLYKDLPLRQALGQLYVELYDTKERFQKLDIDTFQYLSAMEPNGPFTFAAALDLVIETETVDV